MIVGTVREVKDNEYRVGLTPGGVASLVQDGHQVLIETGAGEGSGITDEEYASVGAEILPSAKEVWERAQLIVKVKEPVPEEYGYLRPDLMLFTFLHLAANESLTRQMMGSGVTGIAYETVELADGSLPLLEPMSEIAGRMAVQIAAHYLEKMNGGRGKLLGGVPGVRPSDVVIIGGGTVGTNAAQVALGMGAHVTVLDIDIERLRYLSHILHGSLTTLNSDPHSIANSVSYADVLIGAVLIKGGRAPTLVTREMVRTMKPGSVIIDVAVDQGGCVETSHPTTHSDPVYFVDGVLHYCVANMPGAVPRTSTFALANATIPYVRRLAALGFEQAVRRDPALARGVNVYRGKITYQAVADAFGLPYSPLDTIL
ncbi:MAG TPA: alanine dehydrogenase [Caldilineae bacterium]|nr:alanine dehydrogenase [Caldilineae bacterium]